MVILSDDDKKTKYIKVKYNNIEGYVYSDYIFINLPDIMPDMVYEITNADNSIFKSVDTSIPNVTGKGLYGYTKKLNKKIGKTTHNRGTDMDVTLTDKDNNGLRAQTPMYTLDARSIVRYNDNVSNKLREIMTSVGFETLKSEWWHFQEEDRMIIQINFSYSLIDDKNYRIYRVQDEDGKLFVKNFLIYEFNMAKYKDIWYTKDKDEIEKNKYIIMLDLNEDELMELASNDKVVLKYMEELKRG